MTLFQVAVIIASCLVSSLGIVTTHSITLYAWYLTGAGIVAVITTSLTFGIVRMLRRFLYTYSSRKTSKSDSDWLALPNCGQTMIYKS